MSQYFVIHPQDPQPRLINQAVAILNNGGVIAYPTDSTYALGCVLGDTDAQKRIRDIRGVDDRHHFTLVCRNLTEIGNYAQLNNSQFRLLKANTPGQYTFCSRRRAKCRAACSTRNAVPSVCASRSMR